MTRFSGAARRARTIVKSIEGRTTMSAAIFSLAGTLFALFTARWLGPSDRGIIVLFMTTSSFLMLVGSLGLTTGGRILLHTDPGLSAAAYQRYARALSLIHIVTAGTVGAALLFVTAQRPPLLIVALFVLFATSQLHNYFGRELLHGMGWHSRAILGDAFGSALQTAGILTLFGLDKLTLIAAALVLLVGSVAQGLYLSTLRMRLEGRTPETELSLRSALRFSAPAMITSLGQAFAIRGDRMLLGIFAGTTLVGIYGVAATFSEVLWLVPNAVGQVTFRRASLADSSEAISRLRQRVLWITIAAGGALAALAAPTIDLLLGPAYADAVPITYALIAASLPMASYQMDIAVLNGLGHLRVGTASTVSGSLVLAVGCMIMIPHFGMTGAALASIAAYVTMASIVRAGVRRATGKTGHRDTEPPLSAL